MRVEIIGPADAKIMLVGEAPGVDEDRIGKPFVGYAGRTLDKLLHAAGINRHECLITNVAKEKPPGNNFDFFFADIKTKTPKPILTQWLVELKDEIKRYRPNIIIALGSKANWALTGNYGIKSERGYIVESSLVPGVKVLPTYHPQAVNHEWKLHFQVVMDFRKALSHSHTKEMKRDDRRLIPSAPRKEFLDYLNFLIHDHRGPVTYDIETLQPGSHIYEIGFADSPTHAVSWKPIVARKTRFNVEDELEVWLKIAELFQAAPLIVGQNLAYDNAVIYWNHGIYVPPKCFDTMLAGHCCWPEAPRSLGFLSSVCLDVPLWKEANEDAFYNPSDCANTHGVYEVLSQELTKLDQWDIFNHEMAQLEPATFMHLQGFKIDTAKQQALLEEIDKKLVVIKEELSESLGDTVIFHSSEGPKSALNLNSSKQLQELLYDGLNLPEQFKRRKKKSDKRTRTADEEALSKLERISDNPVLGKILDGRKLYKLRTFIDVELSPEGRVHTNYNVSGANMQDLQKRKGGLVIDNEDQNRSFGRWSSSKSIIVPYGSGNLQNIPKKAREMYIPPPGHELIEADGVQAEAVIVAFESLDRKLMEMFRQSFGMSPKERKAAGFDVHRMKAAELFGIPFEDVTKEQRGHGKTIRHARNYKAGPGTLVKTLKIPLREAKYLIKLAEQAEPNLTLWHQRLERELKQNGRTIPNLFGRKHRFLDRWPKPGENGTLFRSLASYVPQSTVGDWLNKAISRMYWSDICEDTVSIALQLHDAQYVFSPIGEENRLRTLKALWKSMKIELTSSHGDKFYIDADFKAGPSWGEMEELVDVGTKMLED